MPNIGSRKKEIIGLIALSILYFLLRLPNLLSVPIFTDEAIYMRWAQIALNDPTWRFISLVDGKQPLFVWFAMVAQKFIEDPLLAGRLVSVFSGFFTMIGLVLLSYELFKNRTVSFITAFLYIVYPFAQVYDRMALMDGMVGTFAVWGLLFGVLLVRRIRLDIAYTLGFIIGGAALTKSNGFFSAYLLPFTLILFNFKDKMWKNKLLKWAILAAFAFAISQAIYAILRLSPLFYVIAQKNGTFIYTFQEWINHPLEFFVHDLIVMTSQWLTYFNVFLPLSIIAFFNRKFIKENLLLLSYFIVPFVIFALFAKILYPRYLFPMTVSLIPLAALGLYDLSSRIRKICNFKYLTAVLLILFSLYPLYVSLTFTFDPIKSPIDQQDRDQYISSWPSGWGVKEANAYLTDISKDQKVTIYTQGTFGLMPYSIELYQQHNPNLKIVGLWPIESEFPAELSEEASITPTYILFYQPCTACVNTYNPPPAWPLEKVLTSPLGHLTVYKVKAQ